MEGQSSTARDPTRCWSSAPNGLAPQWRGSHRLPETGRTRIHPHPRTSAAMEGQSSTARDRINIRHQTRIRIAPQWRGSHRLPETTSVVGSRSATQTSAAMEGQSSTARDRGGSLVGHLRAEAAMEGQSSTARDRHRRPRRKRLDPRRNGGAVIDCPRPDSGVANFWRAIAAMEGQSSTARDPNGP